MWVSEDLGKMLSFIKLIGNNNIIVCFTIKFVRDILNVLN